MEPRLPKGEIATLLLVTIAVVMGEMVLWNVTHDPNLKKQETEAIQHKSKL
jgi:hypothetical protein